MNISVNQTIQKKLRESVINPLRECGFVGAGHMKTLRDLLSKSSTLAGLEDEVWAGLFEEECRTMLIDCGSVETLGLDSVLEVIRSNVSASPQSCHRIIHIVAHT